MAGRFDDRERRIDGYREELATMKVQLQRLQLLRNSILIFQPVIFGILLLTYAITEMTNVFLMTGSIAGGIILVTMWKQFSIIRRLDKIDRDLDFKD